MKISGRKEQRKGQRQAKPLVTKTSPEMARPDDDKVAMDKVGFGDELKPQDYQNETEVMNRRMPHVPFVDARPESSSAPAPVHPEMADEAEKVSAAWLDDQAAPPEQRSDKEEHDEFHDSELPPPPQLRTARSTADRSKRVKDKNTGIKDRDASGKKQARSR